MEIISHSKHGQNVSTLERAASVLAGGWLIIQGLRRSGVGGTLLAAGGTELIRRGVTGHCYAYDLFGVSTAPLGQGGATTSVPYPLGIRVDSSITINRQPGEVYRFWRDLKNLPTFMRHLQSVEEVNDKRSHWVVRGPAGSTVEWDAEVINEIPEKLIAWRSVDRAQVQNAGSVHFDTAPGGQGTEVHVELQYNPPAGIAGALVAKMFGEEPTQQIKEDLYHLKQVLEAGEVPTIAGQPTGSKEYYRPPLSGEPIRS